MSEIKHDNDEVTVVLKRMVLAVMHPFKLATSESIIGQFDNFQNLSVCLVHICGFCCLFVIKVIQGAGEVVSSHWKKKGGKKRVC